MTQKEKRVFLITKLLQENKTYSDLEIPQDDIEQKKLLRSLMNVRYAAPVSDEFLKVQDEYLKEELFEKGITRLSDLKPIESELYIWRGDITTLE